MTSTDFIPREEMKTKPEMTRSRILNAAFEEMHRNGFQGMRIDAILAKTELKKGALYHHFQGKTELGYAVVEEIISQFGKQIWVDPLFKFDDPLQAIQTVFYNAADGHCLDFNLGCPLNNLAQEMSPVDAGFRARIETIYQSWQSAIIEILKEGQNKKKVKSDINLEECATFILASIEGAIGLAKNAQNKEVYYRCGRQLSVYLDTLSAD